MFDDNIFLSKTYLRMIMSSTFILVANFLKANWNKYQSHKLKISSHYLSTLAIKLHTHWTDHTYPHVRSDEQLPSGRGRVRATSVAARGRRQGRLPRRELAGARARRLRLRGGQRRLRAGGQPPALRLPRDRSQPRAPQLHPSECLDFLALDRVVACFRSQWVLHFMMLRYIMPLADQFYSLW